MTNSESVSCQDRIVHKQCIFDATATDNVAGLGTAVAFRSPDRRVAVSRHARGLSLNFPVLVPTQHQHSNLSMATSNDGIILPPDNTVAAITSPSTTAESWRISPLSKQLPFSPPARPQSPSRRPTDFLTLIATQERKVLELKEELTKAETELTGLKQQWASYEANKKREELKNPRKLGSPIICQQSVSGAQDAEDVEEERRKRRALVEMNNNVNNSNTEVVDPTTTTKLARRGSKRIFEGRHTRTLSLLSPLGSKQTQNTPPQTIDSVLGTQERKKSMTSTPEESDFRPALARMSTLDSIISAESIQQGLGKTYKELAAVHRRSLPPVAADIIVKQGKQVVDGVREGLWTFFEDIRQATVGDEGVNGALQHRQNKNSKVEGLQSKSRNKTGKPGTKGSLRSHLPDRKKEDSFWKEFGFDTPDKNKENRSGHIQKKGSTDSQNIPDLLIDVNGPDVEDEEWDAWETPASTRDAMNTTNSAWPGLNKLTPSKVTRTVNDLMNNWDIENESISIEEMERDRQVRLLTSSHV